MSEDLRREQELARRYGVAGPAGSRGGGNVDGSGGNVIDTGGAYLNFDPVQQQSSMPDYVGAGGGVGGVGHPTVPISTSGSSGGMADGWEGVERHRHPTRLSDVLEEDERSRTSPSRASVASRGRAI